MRDSLEFSTLRTDKLVAFTIFFLVMISAGTYAATSTTVPITAQLGTSIAADLFPVTVKLNPGNVYLTEPVLLFLDNERVGMQVRFQAYDHRPAQHIAISEMGKAQFSGTLGFDPATRQILLHDPRIDKLEFDQKNDVTQHQLAQLKAAWSAQVTNPIRADLPPHPYILPFKNNIQDVSFDGTVINVTLSYEKPGAEPSK
jgi:hypothetical protein